MFKGCFWLVEERKRGEGKKIQVVGSWVDSHESISVEGLW